MGINSKGWDNGGKNMNLDQAEFIDRGSLSRDSGFQVEVSKRSNSLFSWPRHGPRWPTLNAVEMPDLS